MAIAYFGSNGYTVSLPLNDTQDYDLIVDKDGELKKIQAKATNHKTPQGFYQVGLRSCGGTNGGVYKTVVDTNIDYLFILCGDQSMFLIPKEFIRNRNSITLRKESSYDISEKNKSDHTDYSKFLVML